MDGPTLETERLRLRQWRADDLAPYADLLADPAAARFIVPGGEPVTEPFAAWQHAALLAGHWALHGTGMFVVEDKASQCFLGRVGLWHPAGWFGPELAWAVVEAARGQGIAFEAASAALAWSFAALGVDELIHCIDDDNLPSQRLATRLGATPGERIDLFGRPARIWTSRRPGFDPRQPR